MTQRTSAVLIPRGVHSAPEIFTPLCEKLGFVYTEYPAHLLQGLPERVAPELKELWQNSPELWLVPTSVKINRELLACLDACGGRVRAFASVSTGTDHVDLEALARVGLPFLHAPGENAASVAEYVMSALPLVLDESRLLRGNLKAGIVGYGRIGQILGRYLDGLGVDFRFYDPLLPCLTGPGESSEPSSAIPFPEKRAELDRVLDADLISFHVPLSTSGAHATREMVNEDYLKMIRPGAVIVNTSRGAIFTRSSFLMACERFACVMDVFPDEPPSSDLIQAPAFVSPHVAGYNYSARAGGTRRVALNFARLLGQDPVLAPQIPPARCAINVLDFLATESSRLKADPATFSARRGDYPARGDLRQAHVRGASEEFGEYRQKLLSLAASIGAGSTHVE